MSVFFFIKFRFNGPQDINLKKERKSVYLQHAHTNTLGCSENTVWL